MKRQPTERANVFANSVSDEGIIYKIHTEFMHSTPKETNNVIKEL